MGVKNIITDDLTGETLPDNATPLDVRVDGHDFTIYLSRESEETFLAFLKGEAPLLEKQRPARASSKGSGKGSTSIDKHGFDTPTVRAWAIANKIKNANGNPVTDSGRISQSVYDAYRDAPENAK